MFARMFNANNILSAQIDSFKQYLSTTYHYVRQSLYHYLVGDFDVFHWKLDEEAVKRAMAAQDGLGVVRFGPAFYPFHAVFVSPRKPEYCKQQLATIMDLPESSARCPYSYISYKTGSSFFLAMNNDKAKELRSKLSGSLTVKRFEEQAEEKFWQLLKDLETPLNVSEDFLSHHLFSLFSSVLFNYELPVDLYHALKEVTKFPNLAAILLPESAYSLIPDFHKHKQAFNEVVQKFLYALFDNIRNTWDLAAEVEKGNILAKMLESKYPEYHSFAQLTPQDIDELVKDPEIRLSVTGLIGVENLSLVLVPSIMKMYARRFAEPSIKEKLLAELNQHTTAETSIVEYLRDKPHQPYLQAVYLEVLRCKAPMDFLTRYTKNGINTDVINIPVRSMIFFKMSDMLWLRADSNNAAFQPERFLDSEGQLHQDAKMNTGFLLPGGAGRRSCPGATISEWLIKFYFLGFARYVDHLEFYSCKLSQPGISHHASFFKPADPHSELITRDKATYKTHKQL